MTSLAAAGFLTVFRPDDLLFGLVVACVLPVVIVAVTATAGANAGLTTPLLVVGGTVTALALSGTGGLGVAAALRSGLVDGWAQILTAHVPVPATSSRVMVPIALSWTASSTVAMCLTWTRLRFGALLPTVLLWLTSALLGDAQQPPLVAVFGYAAIGAALLAVRVRWLTGRAGIRSNAVTSTSVHDAAHGSEPQATTPSRGWAAASGATIAVVLLTALIAPALTPTRAPAYSARESYEIEDDHSQATNPLTEISSGDLGDDRVVFEVRTDRVPTVLGRFRLNTLVLDAYSHGEWTAGEGYDVTGVELPKRTTELHDPTTVHMTVTPGPAMRAQLPALGRATEIDLANTATVRVQPNTGALAAASVPHSPFQITSVVGRVDPADLGSAGTSVSAEAQAATGTDGVPRELDELLTKITGGAGSPFDQVARLVSYFRATNGAMRTIGPAFSVDRDLPTGFTRAELTRFLVSKEHVGAPMQFVVAFATLARAQGLPTRIVVGYEAASVPKAGQRVALKESDRTAWVEIAFAGIGWVPFDPLPDSADTAMPPEQQALDAQINETATTSMQNPPNVTPVNPARGRRVGHAERNWRWWPIVVAAGAAVALGGLLLPLARKRRRARRRRRDPVPVTAIVSAWDEAVDRLVERGYRERWTATATAIALAARDQHGDAVGDSFDRLAAVLNAALHAPTDPGTDMVDAAWAATDEVLAGVRSSSTRRTRLRAALDPRPLARPQEGLLRPSTAPVNGTTTTWPAAEETERRDDAVDPSDLASPASR